jgi:hypothetical protein
MKPGVLLMVIVVSLAQERPILAQERRGLPPDFIDEAVTAGQRFAAVALTDVSRLPFTVMANPRLVHRSPIRRASQPLTTPDNGRHVSRRRLLIGALVGGVAGGTLGYYLGSKCGPGAPRAECVADGRLVAAVFGGLGALIGVGIAAKTAP